MQRIRNTGYCSQFFQLYVLPILDDYTEVVEMSIMTRERKGKPWQRWILGALDNVVVGEMLFFSKSNQRKSIMMEHQKGSFTLEQVQHPRAARNVTSSRTPKHLAAHGKKSKAQSFCVL